MFFLLNYSVEKAIVLTRENANTKSVLKGIKMTLKCFFFKLKADNALKNKEPQTKFGSSVEQFIVRHLLSYSIHKSQNILEYVVQCSDGRLNRLPFLSGDVCEFVCFQNLLLLLLLLFVHVMHRFKRHIVNQFIVMSRFYMRRHANSLLCDSFSHSAFLSFHFL